ncbi:protein-export chaperone SecB [Paenibacillus sp. GCM10027629]|uniref:protein-export chaperone SecB n=1 Tax=Paenibacillus sp. GCM10027629 TaxID=3273414 RepID=UPI003642774E
MSEEMLSVLRFHDYEVDQMAFIRNHNFDVEKEEVELKFNFASEVHMSKDKSKAIVVMTCRLFDEDFSKNDVPFYLLLTMRGYFNCKDADIEDFELNAMAILMPYIRSTITSFTAQAGIPPVILPPVNVYHLLEKQNPTEPID